MRPGPRSIFAELSGNGIGPAGKGNGASVLTSARSMAGASGTTGAAAGGRACGGGAGSGLTAGGSGVAAAGAGLTMTVVVSVGGASGGAGGSGGEGEGLAASAGAGVVEAGVVGVRSGAAVAAAHAGLSATGAAGAGSGTGLGSFLRATPGSPLSVTVSGPQTELLRRSGAPPEVLPTHTITSTCNRKDSARTSANVGRCSSARGAGELTI